MQPNRIKTSAGMETASETAARARAMLASLQEGGGGGETTPTPTPTPETNPLIEALTARLESQGAGISTSSSSNLQNSINEAIAGTQLAGELSRERLQSERGREVAFARDRQGATITGALEDRRGYATQVVALRELTETTEKEIKDLDKRYQELILAGDAATAQRVADLQVKKLEFLQEQEQNYFNNMISVANLQQEALQMAQQNEQFLRAQEQQQKQFEEDLKQSKYEYERNYGLELDRIALDRQQLEIQRERNQISWAEYNRKAQELNEEANNTNLQAIIAQDMRNQIAGGASLNDLLSTDYMARLFEQTGFEGSSEELATLIRGAYDTVNSSVVTDTSTGTDSRTGRRVQNTFTNETTPRTAGDMPGFVEPAPDGFLPFNF